MAVDGALYSLEQFDVAYIAETTLGTKNVALMLNVNLDAWPTVDFGVERFLGQRHGVGRTKKKTDVYVNAQGKQKQISITGFYDQTTIPDFLENVMNELIGTSPNSFDIAGDFTGIESAHGDTDSDNTGAFTFALISPEGSNTFILTGCFCNRLKIMSSGAEDGGRFHFEADFVSRHNWEVEQSAPTSRVAYATTYRTLYDMSTKVQVGGTDISIYKFELEIIANVKFAGFGALGIPDTIARAIPSFDISCLSEKAITNSLAAFSQYFLCCPTSQLEQ